MSSQESYLINQKVKVPGARIFLAWLLLVLLPVAGSFWCLDYFLAEYSVFAESEQLVEAFNQLESYKSAQVVENFLSNRLQSLAQIKPASGENAAISDMNRQISQLIGGRCIMTIFFDRDRKRLIADYHRPEDLAGVVLPPASLLKRQLPLLDSRKQTPIKNLEQFHFQSDQKRRNALSLQQLFKTITPVTLQPDRVVKIIRYILAVICISFITNFCAQRLKLPASSAFSGAKTYQTPFSTKRSDANIRNAVPWQSP